MNTEKYMNFAGLPRLCMSNACGNIERICISVGFNNAGGEKERKSLKTNKTV